MTEDHGGRVKKTARRAGEAWMRLPSRTRMAIVIFLFCVLVYALLLLLVPRYKGIPTTNGDEPHYLIATESIIHDGDLFIENDYQRKGYLDYYQHEPLEMHDAEGRGGRKVPGHPVFLSVLLVPGFWLLGYKGAALTMLLSFAAGASLTFLVTDRFTRRSVAVVVTLFIFMSYPMLFYSRLIYPETFSVAVISLAVWSGWRLRECGKTLYAALEGLSAGLLLLLHPKFIAIAFAILVLFWITTPARSPKYFAAWLVPALGCVALFLALGMVTFGGNIMKGISATGGGKFIGGYWGTYSVWGIFGLYLDRAWGLFIFAPFFMLFPHGMSLQNNRLEWRRWWIFFLVCIVLHTLLLGTFQSWYAGLAPVNRYLIPLVPLFTILIALFIERCRSQIAVAVAWLLALWQIVTTVWAFRFMVGTYGMLEAQDNIMLPHFLGEGPIKKILMFIFPLYHPAGTRAILLTIAWIILFSATVYAARNYYMLYGGGRVSPVLDIRPFEKVV